MVTRFRSLFSTAVALAGGLASFLLLSRPADAAPLWLHANGNTLYDSNNNLMRLHGANVAGMEWGNYYSSVSGSVSTLVGSNWRANCMRLTVDQDHWFGKSDGSADGGSAYRGAIDSLISICSNAGAYVDLCLYGTDGGQWGNYNNENLHNMPDQNSTTFWRDAGARYKNNSAVLFDLYNEPQNVSWSVWKNGGNVSDNGLNYYTDGMQNILNNIRSVGATNVVIAGGLGKCSDLTGLNSGYALYETNGGKGVMYAAHLYPWVVGSGSNAAPDTAYWDAQVGNPAANYCVIVEETGADNGEAYSPNPTSWCQNALVYYSRKQWSWLGWAFAGAAPAMLDGSGNPTAEGSVFKQELLDDSAASAPIGHTISMKSAASNYYTSCDLNTSDNLRAAFATSVNTWEKFQVISLGGGYIALKSLASGYYVSCDLNNGDNLRAAWATSPGAWERFTWRQNSDGSFGLRSAASGCFVSCDLNTSDTLRSPWSVWPGAWEVFWYQSW